MATVEHELTYDEIARRAYEISESPDCGTDEENWWRAERELLDASAAPAGRTRRTAAKVRSATAKPGRARRTKPVDESPGEPMA